MIFFLNFKTQTKLLILFLNNEVNKLFKGNNEFISLLTNLWFKLTSAKPMESEIRNISELISYHYSISQACKWQNMACKICTRFKKIITNEFIRFHYPSSNVKKLQVFKSKKVKQSNRLFVTDLRPDFNTKMDLFGRMIESQNFMHCLKNGMFHLPDILDLGTIEPRRGSLVAILHHTVCFSSHTSFSHFPLGSFKLRLPGDNSSLGMTGTCRPTV